MSSKLNKFREVKAKALTVTDKVKNIRAEKDKELEAFTAQIQEAKKSSHGGDKKMNFTRKDAVLLKSIGVITGKSDETLLKAFAQEKAMELTSDHSALMNNVIVGELIPEFDPRDAKLGLLARFTKKNLAGKNQEEYLLESEDMQILDTTEGADAEEATWDESKFSITATRATISFVFTEELAERSLVDQMSYVKSKVATAVGRGLMEGIINGQGANSAQQDNGYAATKLLGKKFPGIRAVMSANSKTVNGNATALTRPIIEDFFASEGDLFAQNESEYIVLCGGREYRAISKLVQGEGVTGVNTSTSSIHASKINGLDLLNVSPFLKSVVGSGSGYSETGFVSATAADNDHGVLILLRPSKVFYALDNAKLEVERKPKKNAWEVTYNCKVGWAFHVAELGRMLINIGADIS